MLTHQLIQDDGLLFVSPRGPLAVEDFERLATEVDPYLEANGELRGLMIESQSFPGWENLAGLLSHLRFVRDHHRQIARVAVVSDGAFLSVAPRLADHFVAAEVRHFAAGERDAAIKWLRAGR